MLDPMPDEPSVPAAAELRATSTLTAGGADVQGAAVLRGEGQLVAGGIREAIQELHDVSRAEFNQLRAELLRLKPQTGPQQDNMNDDLAARAEAARMPTLAKLFRTG
jgi:hypothetical protein